MKQRCLNPRNPAYENYGGRGILIAEEDWLRFENFLADMGDPPPGLSLERWDNDAGYQLSNCGWADSITQSRNKRRPKRKQQP